VQRNIIIPFDQGDREACKPITFRMKPAFVTKSGKKRTHTPGPEQLKDLGLRVSPVQPHVGCSGIGTTEEPDSRSKSGPGASVAENALAQMWKPRSPDPWMDEASESPIRAEPAPSPKPRKPRVARAKVSAASKGVIPTTLGGKLPPVSVLSRREFGLRALHR
jgi:hypothetical protein